MSISPDQSRLTACVIGEATPAEQASFDAAVLKDAALRAEAVTLSRTAHRLATALRQEESVGLTPTQRQAIFQHASQQALPPTAPKARMPRQRAWLGPTFATTGIAALITFGLYHLPVFQSRPAGPAAETGIPSVAIRPGAPDKSGTRPVPRPPALAKSRTPAAIPDTNHPTDPSSSSPPPPMSATAPVITVVPAPTLPARDAALPEALPPVKPKAGKHAMDGTLASPVVPHRP